MKKLSFIIPIALTGLLLGSCKKNEVGTPTGTAAFTVVNATIDVPNMAINFAPNSLPYYANKTLIGGASFLEFGLPPGANTINLVSSNDTTHTLYYGNVSVANGGIYSFYVAGQTGSYQTILQKDNIPVFGTDSVAGARFVNLSPDSGPLNVSLQGGSGNEFSSVAYKGITAFKKYSANTAIMNNGGYNFNITDAQGNVLTTFNWIPQVFNKSNTMVITGLVGNGSVSVFAVNNF
jgi:hypothetical protein